MIFSNADIQFAEKEFIWRSYTIAKALSTTKWIKLINKKEFAKAALDAESKTFVVHVKELEVPKITIHLSQKSQITGSDLVQVAALKKDKALTKLLVKYSDFADVFSEEEALVLPKCTKFNKYTIELEDSK